MQLILALHISYVVWSNWSILSIHYNDDVLQVPIGNKQWSVPNNRSRSYYPFHNTLFILPHYDFHPFSGYPATFHNDFHVLTKAKRILSAFVHSSCLVFVQLVNLRLCAFTLTVGYPFLSISTLENVFLFERSSMKGASQVDQIKCMLLFKQFESEYDFNI